MGDTRAFAIILDSTRGTRHLDSTRSSPASLETLESQRTVLDWTLSALSSCGIEEITYVGGYHIQKVIERYPGLGYRYQSSWASQGEVAALDLARPARAGRCLIIRSNVICVPEALRKLTAAQHEVAAGYYEDGQGHSFIGLIALPEALCLRAFEVADTLSRRDPGSQLEGWLSAMDEQGLGLQQVALDSLAAPVSDSAAVARTVFGGKGRTLEQVRPLVKTAIVLDQVRFEASEWRDSADEVLDRVRHTFEDSRVVVRSSAGAEDGSDFSGAGRFTSVLDVRTCDGDRLQAAVDEVVASYSRDGRPPDEADEVLVQPHVDGLAASGVVLTRDMETGAPYYVLNIDSRSGKSGVVTAGAREAIDTIYVSRNADVAGLGAEVDACITLARELEELLHVDNLDIEFGIDRSGQVFLFQVRPIARRARKFELADDDLEKELEQIREFLEVHFQTHPALAGETTVLGTMPDWNPAEMIGTAPRPLALSLYQTLIGKSAWSAARTLIGYREVRPEPLIVSLGGRPFVDVRASLNSFLPAGLDDEIAETWVNHGLRMLHENPRLHDKLEFEVAITCFTFDFDDHAQRLRDAGLDEDAIADFRQRVLDLTRTVLCDEVASIDSQLARLDELTRRRQRWLGASSPSMPALARSIQALVADCEEYGVVPFSVLARYAFMAMSLLRSLRSVGVFSNDEYESILSSIPTVASELSRDMWRHATGRLSTDTFLSRFGHLRPSSYDITSPNYANAQHLLRVKADKSETEPPFPNIYVAEELFEAKTKEIEALLRGCGLAVTARQLQSFVMRSIPGREWAKFEFMKSVDAALEAIAQLGEGLGFSREEMSFLPVDAVLRGALDSSSGAVYMEFRRQIDFKMKRWNMTCALRLPHLVRSTADVSGFRQKTWTPNFISTQHVVAEPVVLESGASLAMLEGRIVLIRAADPGYDWIFSQPIAGLITEYGGVASHMAIRAAEFGLPAAIGCGDLIFNSLSSARLVDLDCATERVLPLP